MCKEEKQGIMRPEWISVEDALPTEDGDYYTITELQHDKGDLKKGTIDIDDRDEWEDGEWRSEDYWWKVVYWAPPIKMELPAELADRPQWQFMNTPVRNEAVEDANGMLRTLSNLRLALDGVIFVRLDNAEIGKRFLEDAEDSMLLIPRSKTEPYPYTEFMAIFCMAVSSVNVDDITRIQSDEEKECHWVDYEKYISGAEDYLCPEPVTA
ncbi:MAG: hypothetical protein IJT44_01380 [Clostridia bacterium]|nr:hypothetical protein [Clostridia bacterium]